MIDRLQTLKETLLRGIRTSLQSSYGRRNPAKASIPLLETARHGLREIVKEDERNIEALRLLSQAEECLLNYREAIVCLERALLLSNSKSKQDLKRLARLKGSLEEWSALPLSPEQLQNLGDFLVRAGATNESKGRTLDYTREWLNQNSISSPESVIDALRKRGASTDFQVFYNIVRG